MTLRIEPVSGSIGAIVHDLDLAAIDEVTWAEVRRAWLDHLVLLFPDQRLTTSSCPSTFGR